MRNNKRGNIFFGILFTVLIFGSLFIIYFNAKSAEELSVDGVKIGERQLGFFKTYQKGENLLFYLDESAKLAVEPASKQLAIQGGHGEDSSLNLIGSSMWYYDNKDLRPNDYENTFQELYSTKIKEYLYPVKEIYFDYDVSITKTSNLSLAAYSRNTIELPISDDFNYDESVVVSSVDDPCGINSYTSIDNYCDRGSRSRCEIESSAYPIYERAVEIAKEKGYILYVTNAHRTFADQQYLKKKYGKYAAEPSCSAPHILGKAIDVILLDLETKQKADCMDRYDSPKPTKKEQLSDMECGDRQILEDIMCEAGFVRWSGEYWHYEYGTKRWGLYHGKNCHG